MPALLLEDDAELLLVLEVPLLLVFEEALLLLVLELLLLLLEVVALLLLVELELLLRAVVEAGLLLLVAVEDEPRFTVDSDPLGDTVLMRVLEVPEVFTRLLTVVWVDPLEEDDLVALPDCVPALRDVPVEEALRAVLLVEEAERDAEDVLVAERAAEEVLEAEREAEAVEVAERVADAERLVDAVLVVVVAAWRSRMSRAFTIAEPLFEGMLAVRTLNDCSGYFLP